MPVLLPLVTRAPDRSVAIEAIRSLGRLGDAAAAPALHEDHSGAEGRSASAARSGRRRSAAIRRRRRCTSPARYRWPIPARRCARPRFERWPQRDPEGFVTVLSGLDPDPHWSVRAALASALGTLPPETGAAAAPAMLGDADQRVHSGGARGAREAAAPADAASVLIGAAEGTTIRWSAPPRRRGLGELKPPERRVASGRGVPRRAARSDVHRPRGGARRARPRTGRRKRGPVLDRGARRQGLGGSRARGGAAGRSSIPRATRWRGSGRRRRRMPPRTVRGAAPDRDPPVSHAGVHRDRSRH